MDGRHGNQLPSIKTAQIMDGRHGNQLPSIKTAQIMDGRHGNQLPSIKTAQIMDGTLCVLCLGPMKFAVPPSCSFN